MKQWSTLKKLIWLKAMSAVKEYSGAIVTFFANAVKPLKALIIALQPIQDLHGYDHPWPSGGGKNRCPISSKPSSTGTVSFTNNLDGSWTVNGTSGSSVANTPSLRGGVF